MTTLLLPALLIGMASAGELKLHFRTAPGMRRQELSVRRQIGEWERVLCDSFSLPLSTTGQGIEIEVGFTNSPSKEIGHSIIRSRNGFFGLIRVPAEAQAVEDELGFALAAVLLRTAIYNSASDVSMATEPPVWFVRGIARHAAGNRRAEDFENFYSLWSSAKIPGVGILWQPELPLHQEYPSISSQLAAWLLEQRGLPGAWQAWTDSMARGEAWQAQTQLAEWLGHTGDLCELDGAWDSWLLQRARKVINVGVTSEQVSLRFRSLLLLYPWESAIYNPVISKTGLPLWWCIENPDSIGIRQAAAAKSRQLALYGAGRDSRFLRMTAAYADAMQRLAKGTKAKQLREHWEKAESLRKAIDAEFQDRDQTPGQTP